MMKPRQRLLAAIGTLRAPVTTGGAATVLAHATPAPPPPPAPPASQQCDAPEPGDTPDQPGAPDTDNIQDGDQGGPEVPDGPC